MKTEDLSIVIPAFGCAKTIASVLDCVFLQSIRPKEVIIVDDKSPDNLLSVLQHYRQKIDIISNKKNLGLAASYNIGLKRATGKYLMTLHSDCLLEKNYIESLLEVLKTKKDAGGVCGEYDFKDFKQISYPDRVFAILNKLPTKGTNDRVLKEISFLEGKADIYKREAIEPIGFFSENLRLTCEDQDLCAKLRNNGWKVFQLPSSKFGVQFNTTQDSLKKVFNKQRTYSRGQAYILLTHGKAAIQRSSKNRDIRTVHRGLQLALPLTTLLMIGISIFKKSLPLGSIAVTIVAARYGHYYSLGKGMPLRERIPLGFYGLTSDLIYCTGLIEGAIKTKLKKYPI